MRSLAFAALGLLQTWEPLRPSGESKKGKACDDDASNVASQPSAKIRIRRRCTGGAAELVIITPESSFTDAT